MKAADRADNEDLPVESISGLSVIHTLEEVNQTISLLEEGWQLEQEIQQKEARLEEIKAALQVTCNEYDLKGVKNNGIGFLVSWVKGRKTLSREKLLENGVLPKVISDSYNQGEGYYKRMFVEVKRKTNGS